MNCNNNNNITSFPVSSNILKQIAIYDVHLFAENVTDAGNASVRRFVLSLAQVLEEGAVDVDEVGDAREDDLKVRFKDVALFETLVKYLLHDAKRSTVAPLRLNELCNQYERQ